MKLLVLIATLLVTTTSWARITLPANFAELQGAYSGRGLTSKKSAYLLVYKIPEDGQTSGRFMMFLLTNDRNYGQILQGEYLGGTGIGVLVQGTTTNQKYIEAKRPPAGILKLGVDKDGQRLELAKQDNSLLEESYAFYDDSDDIKVNQTNPVGFFKNRDDTVSGTQGTSADVINAEVQVPSLKLSGSFVGIFEDVGVMVLRKQVLDNSLTQYNEGEISGLMVSIYRGRKPMVIVGGLPDGRPTRVQILPLD